MAQNTERKKSLVLITVDCLRADHCGWHGYSQPTTPFLDTLARESLAVMTAIVAGAPTYYSVPAIMASRMPLALGRDIVGLAPGEHTLASVLRDSGYATAAFSAANPYISAHFGYDQGFEVFQDFLYEDQSGLNSLAPDLPDTDTTRGKLNRLVKHLAGAVGLSRLYNELYFRYCMKTAPAAGNIDRLRRFPDAGILVDHAISWLTTVGDRPFFLWLHFMDPHSPYYPRNDAFRDLTGKDIDPERARYLNHYWNRSDLTSSGFQGKKDEVVRSYDAGIRAADNQIARLVSSLRETNLWDDCVFTVTADHGEEFLEHGGRFHSPLHLGDEIVHVPLLIRVPGQPGQKSFQFPLSHLHLAPTLLEMMDVQSPSSFKGRSQWTNLRGGICERNHLGDSAIIECGYGCTNPFKPENRYVPRLLGVRDRTFKLTMRLEPGAVEKIYNLETDPDEKYPNVDHAALQNRKRLLQTAGEYLRKVASEQNTDLRMRARLQDLQREVSS